MSKQPLVSVIVPTYNSADVLDACLRSISVQTYKNIEIIVVDNSSSDNTQAIANRYTDRVYNKGPERSAQRNHGVRLSSGEYVLIIDSDMELTPVVIEECISKFLANKDTVGLIIPEESFGKGFWAQCRRLERSLYIGVPWMEAARAFRKPAYLNAGGYNEDMVSGEDWDLSQRISIAGELGRIVAFIRHNEGNLRLIKTLQKKYYYAKKIRHYKNGGASHANVNSQFSLSARYSLFLSSPKKLFENPFVGIGMLYMKTAEYIVGGLGYLIEHQR